MDCLQSSGWIGRVYFVLKDEGEMITDNQNLSGVQWPSLVSPCLLKFKATLEPVTELCRSHIVCFYGV